MFIVNGKIVQSSVSWYVDSGILRSQDIFPAPTTADTIPDIELTGVDYQDIYAATGITVGTSLIIQNKTTGKVWIQISATQPPANSTDGFLMEPDVNFFVLIEAGESGCWVFGNGPLGVREG